MNEAGDVGGNEDGMPLKDRRLEERAIRERWPLPKDVRIRILKRMARYLDESTEDGSTAKPRVVMGAAKVILAADRLNVDQERLNLAGGISADDAASVDVISEADRIRGERKKRLADAPA